MPSLEAQAWSALVTGVRDYLGKNGFPGAIIGLSGGIDSALVLAVAVDALGASKVRTVMMPSPGVRPEWTRRRGGQEPGAHWCDTSQVRPLHRVP